MRNTGTTASSATAAPRHLAHQFVRCYSWPARGPKLLREHPHILSSETRRLLERDTAWLLFPTTGGGGGGPGGGATDQQHWDRAFGLIRAAALLEMCAGRPRHELQLRIFALARACQKTCREHRARAEAIYRRVRRRWDEDQRTRGRAAAAARSHGAGGGRGIRVKFRRGNVALNYAQCDLERARLAHMSFDELYEALRGRTPEEREAALDQITQPGGEIRILRERSDPEAAVGQVVTGMHELYL